MSSDAMMPLPEEMASRAPFPPKCPVFIYDDKTHLRSQGIVQNIYLQMSSMTPDMFYDIQIQSQDVQNANSTGKFRGIQLCYQNGCNVTVKIKEDSWPGVVLGTCDIPDSDEREAFTPRKFWYSVQLFDGSKTMIEHEILPDALTFRSEPFSPEEADDTEISSLGNGQEVVVAELNSRKSLVKNESEQVELAGEKFHEDFSDENKVWMIETYIEDVKKEIVVDTLFGSMSEASKKKNILADIRAKIDTEDVIVNNACKGCKIKVWTLSELKSKAATSTVLASLEDKFSLLANRYEYSEYINKVQKAYSIPVSQSKQDKILFLTIHSLEQRVEGQSSTSNTYAVESESTRSKDIHNTNKNQEQNSAQRCFRQIAVPLPKNAIFGEFCLLHILKNFSINFVFNLYKTSFVKI